MIEQAIVLAAGLGKRLRPLTDTCPKPMLEVHGKPLLVHNLHALDRAGVKNIVIHVSYLADEIIDRIGDGRAWGINANICYSRSKQPLESGGGIKYSTSLLKDLTKEFICVNSDILTDYDYKALRNINLAATHCIGHLVLVPNPAERPYGDFDTRPINIESLDNVQQHLLIRGEPEANQHAYTYSGIAVYHPDIMKVDNKFEQFSILDNITKNIENISASVHNGFWYDVGTVDRYNVVNRMNLGFLE